MLNKLITLSDHILNRLLTEEEISRELREAIHLEQAKRSIPQTMNTHRPKLYPDCTGLIRQFATCACGKYRRIRHRGIICDCCDTEVRHKGYDFMFFLRKWTDAKFQFLRKTFHKPRQK